MNDYLVKALAFDGRVGIGSCGDVNLGTLEVGVVVHLELIQRRGQAGRYGWREHG